MGLTLRLEAEGQGQGQEPHWFTQSDSKMLLSYLTEHAWSLGNLPDVLGALAKNLGIDLRPLARLGSGQQPSREEMLAHGATEEDWQKEVARNEAAWQKPEALLGCLVAVIQGLRRNPEILEQLETDLEDQADEYEEYFLEGTFLQDIEDLAKMARWAQSSGATRLRLVAD